MKRENDQLPGPTAFPARRPPLAAGFCQSYPPVMRLPLRYPANIIIININIIIINNNNSGCSSSSSSSSLISRISSRLVVGRVILSKINKSEGKVNKE